MNPQLAEKLYDACTDASTLWLERANDARDEYDLDECIERADHFARLGSKVFKLNTNDKI